MFQNSSKWKEIAKQGSWSTIKWPNISQYVKNSNFMSQCDVTMCFVTMLKNDCHNVQIILSQCANITVTLYKYYRHIVNR